MQSFVDGGTINGASYIVPSFSSAQPVVYRKDLFAEAGYETFPASWEDLRDACIKISELHPDIAGFGIGFGINENEGEQVFRSMMWDYGGGLFDAEGNISADCPENAEALQLYVDMWNAGALPADAASWDAGSNNANYMQETVAMTCNAYTILSALAEPGYEALNKNTGVAMRPAGPAGSHNDICTYGWGIFADTEAMETAQAFLRYMSEPTWYAGWIEEPWCRWWSRPTGRPSLAASWWNSAKTAHPSGIRPRTWSPAPRPRRCSTPISSTSACPTSLSAA